MRVKKKGYVEAPEIKKELNKLTAKIKDIQDKTKALNEESSIEYFREKLKGNHVNSNKKNFSECLEEYFQRSALTKKSIVIHLALIWIIWRVYYLELP